jgi:hypothetical protein
MPRLKLFGVETKVFERSRALGAIPRIAEQHSSDVPKNGVNGGHG